MSEYIIINFVGGLGNRFFQFAAAYSYAKEYNKIMVFVNMLHSPHSNINYNKIFFKDIETVNINTHINIYRERAHCIYNKINNINGNVSLVGYFQSEKYFKNVSSDIFERFSCKTPLEKLHNKYIYLNNACFIHLRRGDFVGNTNYDLKLIEKQYYERCMEDMKNKYNDVYFYIISDDIEWCKNNPLFIADNIGFINTNEIESLWIMQLCKYGGICPNSTYSWWGGWLNKYYNKDSTVFFPNRLTLNNYDFTDTYSEGFTIINVD